MRAELQIADLVSELEKNSLLPAIIFRTSRSQCDVDVQRAQEKLSLHGRYRKLLQEKVEETIKKYDMDAELIRSHPHYKALMTSGVGAHHAGQLLLWRLLLEELMSAGVLRVLVATGTVAAGVDFPARTVVVTAHSRRGAEGFTTLTSAEFQQMSGRAGRRGKDTVGFCFGTSGPFCDARALLRISKRPPEPLISAYFPSPSTVLNLLRYRNVDDLRFTVEKSLAAFVDSREADEMLSEAEKLEKRASEVSESQDKKLRKRVRRLRRQAEELSSRQMELLEQTLGGLQNLGYLEGSNLSEKGFWAANLCTSLVLEIAEAIEGGLLKDLSAEQLVCVLASLCGDSHRQYLQGKTLPAKERTFVDLEQALIRVQRENIPGVYSEREVIRDAGFSVVQWMHAESWHQYRGILLLSGVAEGDAARLITQTADHLNQILRLSESHPQLCFRAEEAKRLILRPPLTEVISVSDT